MWGCLLQKTGGDLMERFMRTGGLFVLFFIGGFIMVNGVCCQWRVVCGEWSL